MASWWFLVGAILVRFAAADPHEVVTLAPRRAATAAMTRRICLRERGHGLAKLSSP
jgi:uncharacterized protein YbjT (DUF2867 family)